MTQIDPPFLIGVDGGGTGCRAAVATPDGRILAEGKGGRANVSTDCATAIDSVLTATRNAIESAGLDVADMPRAVAHLGLAGYTGPEMGPRVQAGLPFAKSVVTEDTTTTIVGAVGEQDCHLIALGTGTIVGRQKAGVQTCIGGWCYQVSDQASGAWLGHGVLEQTLLVVDGITPASPLSQQMLDKFGGGAGIVQFSLKARPGDFATLAHIQEALPSTVDRELLLVQEVFHEKDQLDVLRAEDPVSGPVFRRVKGLELGLPVP